MSCTGFRLWLAPALARSARLGKAKVTRAKAVAPAPAAPYAATAACDCGYPNE